MTEGPSSPHRIVLRFASIFPSALPRFEMHGARRGGDTAHVDPARTPENRILIGTPDWRQQFDEVVAARTAQNFSEELEALKRRKRWKEIEVRLRRGREAPWRASSEGPLREVILTAGRKWFEGIDPEQHRTRQQLFEAKALDWLQSRFGEACIYARADHDEMTYHIHAILAPWTAKTSARRGTQYLLQPSPHPLLKDYEAAQDDVGAHFAEIGLERGERAAARRREVAKEIETRKKRRAELRKQGEAVAADLAAEEDPRLPRKRKHVPTPVWWAEEKRRLLEEDQKLEAKEQDVACAALQAATKAAQVRGREAAVAAREKEVETVIDLIDTLATGQVVEEADARARVSPLVARVVTAMKKGQAHMLAVSMRLARRGVEERENAVVLLRERVEAEVAADRQLIEAERTALRSRSRSLETYGAALKGFVGQTLALLPDRERRRLNQALQPTRGEVDAALAEVRDARHKDAERPR